MRAWNWLFCHLQSASAPALIGLFCGTLSGVSAHPHSRNVAIFDWNGELQLSGRNFAPLEPSMRMRIEKSIQARAAPLL